MRLRTAGSCFHQFIHLDLSQFRTEPLVRSLACRIASAKKYPTKKASVFPNPADHEIYFQSPVDHAADYAVYNLMGTRCFNVRVEAGGPFRIRVDELPAGIYFLVAEDEPHPPVRFLISR